MSNTVQVDARIERPRASATAIWGALLFIYVIWGSTYLAIRFAIETLPPFLFAGVRFLIAGGLLYGLRRLAGDRPATGMQWRSAVIVGLLLLSGGHGGVVWAEGRVASGLVALLAGTVPLWMVLMDWLRPQGQRPRRQSLLGVLIGFAGIALLVGTDGLRGGGPVDPRGALVAILGASLWAAGSLYSRRAPLPDSPLLGTSLEMVAGAVGLLALGTMTGEWQRVDPAGFSQKSLMAMVYLIAVGSLGGYSAYVWLLRVAPTPLVSTYAYVNPMVAILLGNVFAAEPISPRTLVAAAIILGSVVLTTMSQPVAPSAEPGGIVVEKTS